MTDLIISYLPCKVKGFIRELVFKSDPSDEEAARRAEGETVKMLSRHLLIFLCNPSVTASPRHLPLHKGGKGKCKFSAGFNFFSFLSLRLCSANPPPSSEGGEGDCVFSAHIVGDGVLDAPQNNRIVELSR